ncbi:sugar kinase [Bowdeniella nasicola]|uniref:Sugar kinase n=1 Tax=Bowdeniella nasicola TaxID=208480 RepID=A0A1Q5Q1F1_9ACTO|nr:PfkB family carbohydrate kinase [Bowdeniella nasicola]OKL53430.1 sugar kinase [Bowdeniella nasicola]
MPRVVHTAQALVDIVAEVPSLPRRGDNVNAASVARYAGGAVTILLAARRMGAPAVHAGAIGTGPNGDLIREVLTSDGIDISADPIPHADTGECFVMVEPTAERTFVTIYGAERMISTDLLHRAEARGGDLLCVSGYSLYEPTRDPLLDYLRALPSDVRIVLDPGAPFAGFSDAIREEMCALSSVWTSNADEARDFTGAADNEAAMRAIARELPDDAVVIVRDGKEGSRVLAGAGSEIAVCPGYPREAVDTNGAGDTHTGAMLGLVAGGFDWELAAQAANAAGAITVTRKGPSTAPNRDEVADFLRAEGEEELAARVADVD